MINYIDSFPGREIIKGGRTYLYFGGTSYLGLQTNPEFQSIFIKNIKKYGISYGASRKSNVRFSIFEEAEAHLARIAGSEGCISMSSGYLAGQLLVQHFNAPQYKIFYAPNTHSALHHYNVQDHATFSTLNIALRTQIENRKGSIPVVMMDSIDFSGCNYPNFDGLKSLPLDKIILIVDDSHGMGVVGTNGGGVFRQLTTLGVKELIICSSLGKGFGIQAGAILGKKHRIELLTNSTFFGSASPASPAAMATLVKGQEIISFQGSLLKQNMELFISQLGHPELFLFMNGHPAFSFAEPDLVPFLESRDIIVTNFKYPRENGDTLSRIVISASHQREDILKICNFTNSYHFDKFKKK